MSVSQRPPPSSIDVSDLPVRVAEAVAGMAAVCRRQFGPDRSAEGFEEAERRVREGVHALGCEVLGAFVEDRDDGASRIERDGQCWFRAAATPKTIMTTLGPVRYRRACYRNGASRASLVPVDDSLGLVDDYLPGAPRYRHHCRRRRSPRQLDLPGEPLTRGAGGRLLACLRASPHRLRPCRLWRYRFLAPLDAVDDLCRLLSSLVDRDAVVGPQGHPLQAGRSPGLDDIEFAPGSVHPHAKAGQVAVPEDGILFFNFSPSTSRLVSLSVLRLGMAPPGTGSETRHQTGHAQLQ